MQNQLLGEHKGSLSGRDVDQTAEYVVAAWDDRSTGLSALRLKECDRIDIFVFQERERLLFAHNVGRQIRRDLIIKIRFQQFSLFSRQLIEVDEADSLRLQFSHQLLIDRRFFLIQVSCLLQNRFYLLFARHIRFIFPDHFFGFHLIHQCADPDTVELIQV